MAVQRFVVLCVDYCDAGDHVDYVLHVTHACGHSWKTHRRYSALLSVHEKLCAAFRGVPTFPPKGIPGLGLVLGTELVISRINSLQTWLNGVTSRDDIARSSDFQCMLDVQMPERVSSVRVGRWLPASEAATGTATVELTVDLQEQSARPRPVDALKTSVKDTRKSLGGVGGCTPCPLSSPALASVPVRMSDLPCGDEVTIEVRAANGAGTSDATTLRLRVPGRRAVPFFHGMRVRAVWAGDGRCYDAIVHRADPGDAFAVVTWLRPAPLSSEVHVCVCDSGGDDTAHRTVLKALVTPVDGPLEGDEFDDPPRVPAISPEGKDSLEAFASEDLVMSFQLRVVLDESHVEQLEWLPGDELSLHVDSFVATHRLKALFRGPLLAQAETMVRTLTKTACVDIVDLVFD